MNLRALLPGIRPADLRAAAVTAVVAPPTLDLGSPWTPTHNLARVLDGLVLEEILGPDVHAPLTRAEAMQVPAVKRARNIICGVAAMVPLRRYRGAELLADQGWAASTATAVSAAHRHAMTADDLLFYGWSCWSVTRGADNRTVLNMDRIKWGAWSVDEVGRVLVDRGDGRHIVVDQRTVMLIPGLTEGILQDNSGTIRHAADLQRAAATAARHPHAYFALRQTQGTALKASSDDPAEITVENTLATWRAARRSPEGGVGFIPLGLEAEEYGAFSEHLLVEGRNAAAVDIARITNLPADLLDAAGQGSLTYTNARDNDRRAIQYGAGLYLTAMQASISQDAISPRGEAARFDLADWLEDPTPDGETAPVRPRPPDTGKSSGDVSRETVPAPTPAPEAAP